MLIVTGAVIARPDNIDVLRQASIDHVHRSRGEDGCLVHSVHVDAENPLRLFFYEQWRDVAALKAHGAQPGSRDFLAAVREHAASTEPLAIFVAAAIEQ